jgi:hypothetical protein
MGQVVRQDLAGGRLLALEDDVPELIHATEVASESMRRLIGDLRSSPIGAHGLKGTLELLCQQVSNDAGIRVCVDLAELSAPPMVQLLAYQVGVRRCATRFVTQTRAASMCHSVLLMAHFALSSAMTGKGSFRRV